MTLRQIQFLAASIILLATVGCGPTRTETVRAENPQIERRLDDIQAYLTVLSEQLDELQAQQDTQPVAVDEGLTLKPVVTKEEVEIAESEASKRARLAKLARRSPPPATKTTRKSKSTRKKVSYTSLAKKHIRVPVSAKQVQEALMAAGCNPGKIDGKVGSKTIAAIREFQGKNGLKVDGVVGKNTWAKLSGAAVEQPAGETDFGSPMQDFKF